MGDDALLALPVRLSVGHGEVVVGFRGAFGPALLALRPGGFRRCQDVRHLAFDPHGASVPCVQVGRDGLRVAYAVGDEVCLRTGPGGMASLAEPRSLAAGAGTSVDVGLHRGRTAVAASGSPGLLWQRVPVDNKAALADPLPIPKTGRRSVVRLSTGATGTMVVHGSSDDSSLHVALPAGAQLSAARHPLRAPPASLDLLRVRETTYVVIGYAGDAAGHVDVAVLDATGVAKERPHAALSVPGVRLCCPRLVWADTAPLLVVGDPAAGSVLLSALDGTGRVEHVQLPSAAALAGSFDAAYFRKRLHVGAVLGAPGAAARELSYLVCRRDGSDRAQHSLDCTPLDTDRRRREAELRDLLRAVWTHLQPSAGYRQGQASAARLDPDQLGVTVEGEQTVTLRADPEGRNPTFELRVARAPDDPQPSLLRRAWSRLRGGRDPELQRWAEACLGDVLVISARRAGGVSTIQIDVQSLPAPAALARWFSAVGDAPELR